MLTFDPKDNAAAAQQLRVLKEQLCTARQRGMPAWLANVHSHTTLESHLSKGYHAEGFGLFLELNAYTSRDDKPAPQEQPQAPEGNEELLGLAGLARTSGPEPGSSQNTLVQGNPG